MRIIDTHRDYYDCIQRVGYDSTCQFIRKPSTITISAELCDMHEANMMKWGSAEVRFWAGLIGFCGEIFPFAVSVWGGGGVYYKQDLANLHSLINDKCQKKWEKQRLIRQTTEFFDKKRPALQKIFTEHRAPIFFIYETSFQSQGWQHGSGTYECELNFNRLEEYNFQRVKDPYTAYQELAMYLSGVLGPPQKPMPEISDETRAEIHGFNKFSFRTDKNTKPNRKGKRNGR